jgi:hypothetical protein
MCLKCGSLASSVVAVEGACPPYKPATPLKRVRTRTIVIGTSITTLEYLWVMGVEVVLLGGCPARSFL